MKTLRNVFRVILPVLAVALLLVSCSKTDRQPQLAKAPDFVLDSLAGGTIHLGALSGKVVLLEFMSVSCGVCDSVNKDLSALYDEFSKDGFTPVMISLDPPGTDLAGYVKFYRVLHPVALDPNHEASTAYRVRGTPTLVLIDQKGVIRRLWQGYAPQLPEVMKNEIRTLLSDKTH